ncbi:MAG: 50S ribosomal protein L24 [Clostridia bacterium]
MNKKLNIKKDDTVMILSGKSKGKKGKVLEVSPTEGKIIVENVSMVSKHVKPKKQGQQGGIIKTEGALYACKAMVICPKCGKPTRVGHKVLDDGKKVRVCKNPKCRETI